MKKPSDGRSILQSLQDRGLTEDLERICKEGHVTVTDVLGVQRYASIVKARHLWWRHLRTLGLSYPEISRLTQRDHVSIMYACREDRNEKGQ